jgi:hypothetical protein
MILNSIWIVSTYYANINITIGWHCTNNWKTINSYIPLIEKLGIKLVISLHICVASSTMKVDYTILFYQADYNLCFKKTTNRYLEDLHSNDFDSIAKYLYTFYLLIGKIDLLLFINIKKIKITVDKYYTSPKC